MPPSASTARVLAALYVAEGAGLLCGLIAYKNGDRSLLALFTGRYGFVFIGGALSALAAITYLVFSYRRAPADNAREFWFAIAMNLVTVILLLILGETVVRLGSSKASNGIAVAGVQLLPRSWEDMVAQNGELVRMAPDSISFFVPDDLLGWVVGPSRQSENGLYSSSVEGIRSPQPGISYATDSPSRRIALVGDSFAFGLEVRFEDSWGHQLEQDFGRRCSSPQLRRRRLWSRPGVRKVPQGRAALATRSRHPRVHQRRLIPKYGRL